jgi:HemY protein
LQGNDERRDDWLRLAYEHTPEAANAVLLTQAELQLDQKQYEQALATLRKLEENTPNQSQAMALLGKLYFRLEDWDALEKLLPRLESKGRVAEETLQRWSISVHLEHLKRAADSEAVMSSWQSIPRKLRKEASLLAAYADNLMRTGQHELAEKELAKALKTSWNSQLVALFGKVESKDSVRQLKKAESWLRDHPEDAALLLTAARLCLRNELWGKARSYLETAISIQPTPESYQEYGRLLSRLGEADASADAYRTGLHLVSRSPLPAIPHIDPDRS